MFEDGYQNIVNIDYSPTIVKAMEEKYKQLGIPIVCKYNSLLTDKQTDALNMSEFQNQEFNVVIDKGTMDSILCGENSVPIGDKLLKEVYRILSHDGVFICVSYGDEEHRKTILATQDWEVKIEKIPKPTKMIITNVDPGEKDSKNFHYVYIMVKKPK